MPKKRTPDPRREADGASAAADSVRDEFAIVAIGASAGGLEAFGSLLSSLPNDTGMAFVVLSHLSPTQPSALSELLGRASSMPVIDAVDEQRVEPDHVYVLPPGRDLTIRSGRLRLQPRPTRGIHRPVDLFFRSLADERQHRAIGVILSGTATDGTLGIRAIKDAGGITFAQDDTARRPEMPHSAIAEGFVDFVLPPEAIGRELVRISRVPAAADDSKSAAAGDLALGEVLQIVRREMGVDFTHYKENTLRRRLQRRMILRKTDTLPQYTRLLRDTPAEVQALHDDLLIGVTSFFRDSGAFDTLARTAFPELVSGRQEGEPLRIWVLGCSTGEEAYSLAIAVTEWAESGAGGGGRCAPPDFRQRCESRRHCHRQAWRISRGDRQ